jgi:hypothetical protein
MPLPKKKTRQCRRLAADASQAARPMQAQSVDTSSDPVGPASDGEGSQGPLQSLSDQELFPLEDEFPESIVESNIAEDIDNNILTWKDGACYSLRPVYNGDSRSILWRPEVKKRSHHDSVKDVLKITSFFSPSQREPAFHPRSFSIEMAINKLNAEINITPNVIVKGRARARRNGIFESSLLDIIYNALPEKSQKYNLCRTSQGCYSRIAK